MTRLPILFAVTVIEERRREAAALRTQRLARESRAEQRLLGKQARERAREAWRSRERGPAEIDVIIDLTDRASEESEQKEYARS